MYGYNDFLPLICLCILLLESVTLIGCSPLEDKLETQFDLREPRTFNESHHDLLSVRQAGFYLINVGFPDGHVEAQNIGNWEVFAKRYWYETRTPNSSCPMMPDGIAAEADWALMVPCMFGKPDISPRIIYVHSAMLPHFVGSPLRFMNTTDRFVLVSAGLDMTVPRQIDQRYKQSLRGFGGNDGGQFFRILVEHPMIIHWFAENRDVLHPKLSTLPTGMSTGTNPDNSLENLPDPSTLIPVTKRPMKIFSSDRVRTGTGQWALRGEIRQLCLSLPDICLTPPDNGGGNGIDRIEYLKLLVSVPFVACVQGGGVDPSPKAWEAVLAGAIPIIQSSWVDDAYEQLPLVIIDDWHSIFNTSDSTANIQAKFQAWAAALAPYYEVGSAKRKATLERLRTKYWVGKIQEKIDEYDAAAKKASSARSLRSSSVAGDRQRISSSDGLPTNLAVRVPRARPLHPEEIQSWTPIKRALSDGFYRFPSAVDDEQQDDFAQD